MALVSAQKITVSADRLRCRVLFDETCPRFTTPQIMARLLEKRPKLSEHACVNKKGPTFAAVMNHTPLIHVLEHLVIDFQVASQPQSATLFVGTSAMVSSSPRVGEIEVSFMDDVLALDAVNKSIALLNEALR